MCRLQQKISRLWLVQPYVAYTRSAQGQVSPQILLNGVPGQMVWAYEAGGFCCD